MEIKYSKRDVIWLALTNSNPVPAAMMPRRSEVDSEEAMVAMVEEAMQSVAYVDRLIQRDDHVIRRHLVPVM